MSSPMNLDLDFLDYSPSTSQNETHGSDKDSTSVPPASQYDRPGVQIRIPDTASQQQQQQQSYNQTQVPPSPANNLFQNLIGNATIFGSQSTGNMSEEAVRRLMWAANKQRQGQLKSKQQSSSGFSWGLNYLSQYFDVSTTDVVERVLWSAIPLRKMEIDIDNLGGDTDELMAPLANDTGANSTTSLTSDKSDSYLSASGAQRPYSYVERFIQSRPDLYGPFWISTTLIFVIGILSNIVSFANYHSKLAQLSTSESLINTQAIGLNKSAELFSEHLSDELDNWHYSMDELNMSSSVIMVYVTMMPTFMWFCFWFRGCSRFYTLTETVCAYGYSLSIFIPLAVTLTISNLLFRYFMITLASALSGIVLMLSFLPVARSDPNPASSHMLLAIVPLCQFGMAYLIHRIMLQ